MVVQVCCLCCVCLLVGCWVVVVVRLVGCYFGGLCVLYFLIVLVYGNGFTFW